MISTAFMTYIVSASFDAANFCCRSIHMVFAEVCQGSRNPPIVHSTSPSSRLPCSFYEHVAYRPAIVTGRCFIVSEALSISRKRVIFVGQSPIEELHQGWPEVGEMIVRCRQRAQKLEQTSEEQPENSHIEVTLWNDIYHHNCVML